MELDDLLNYSIEEASPFFRVTTTERTSKNLLRWTLPYLGSVRQIARNMNAGWKDWRSDHA